MTKKRTTGADVENIRANHFLYKRFELLALNTFKWEGLPDTIQERHIERVLFNEGQALFFKDAALGLLCLPCMDGGRLNVYGDPLTYNAHGYGNASFRDIALENCVLIENNKLRMPTAFAIEYFSDQLFEIVRTRDVNIKTLKAPFFIVCDDKSVLTYKKIMEEIDNNAVAVFGDKSFNIDDAVKVFQTGAKCLTAELTDTYHDVMNEALTYLGINNANTDKRERLITSEAESNNQFIDSCAGMFLEARQRAAKEINKKFGLNISVDYRTKREPEGGIDNVESDTAPGSDAAG